VHENAAIMPQERCCSEDPCILLAVATISRSAFAWRSRSSFSSGVGRLLAPMGRVLGHSDRNFGRQESSVRLWGSSNAHRQTSGAYFAPLIVGHLNKKTGHFLSGFAYLWRLFTVRRRWDSRTFFEDDFPHPPATERKEAGNLDASNSTVCNYRVGFKGGPGPA